MSGGLILEKGMRCGWCERMKPGIQDEQRRASLSFPLYSSLRIPPYRRSSTGNEPWSCSPSWGQQIAAAYRLWCGASSLYLPVPPVPSCCQHPFLYSFSSVFMGGVDLCGAVSRSRPPRAEEIILPLLIRQIPNLLDSEWAIHLEWPRSHPLFPHFSKWPDVTQPS